MRNLTNALLTCPSDTTTSNTL